MKKQLSQVMSIILVGVLLVSGLTIAPSDGYAAGVPRSGTWVDVGQPAFSQGVAAETSLYIDNGTPYVAYRDGAFGNGVTVMKYDGSDWLQLGSSNLSVGSAQYISIYVDNGTPYVLYSDVGNGSKATVKKYDAANDDWVTVGIAGFSVNTIVETSLYVYNGTPYVAYVDGDSGFEATVMMYDGFNWQLVGNAGFSAGRVRYPSLKIDTGTLYLAYQDEANNNKATVMTHNGTDWVNVGIAGFSLEEAEYTSLYMDNGTPYVAYSDVGTNSRKTTVMKWNGSDWDNVGNAGFSSGVARYQSLTIHNGVPYVAYRDGVVGNKVTVMKYDGSNWVSMGTVGFSKDAVTYISLFVSNEILYVAYQDWGNGNEVTVKKFIPSGPTLIADTSNNDYTSAIDITFTDDPVWRGAITEVNHNGVLLNNTNYTISAGKITINAGVLEVDSSPFIIVKATGYSDGLVQQYITGNTPPSLTADTTNNDTASAIDITFTDDPAWRGAITKVNIDGQETPITNYTISVGKITINAGVLAAGYHSILVRATGYHTTVSVQQLIASNASPSLTADTTNHDTANDIEITFTDDPAWRGAITAVKDGLTSLGVTNYNLIAGKITINAGVLAAGSHSITVTATGYSNTMVSQTITTTSQNGSDPVAPTPAPAPAPTPAPTPKPVPTPAPAPSDGEITNFSDISGHWAEKSINQASDSGIVRGYSDGTFKPSKTVTRAEFAVMLMNTLKQQGVGAELTFKDTTKIGAWAKKAVAQAVEAGIVKGYSDGTFRPDAEITRVEMAAMIANALGLSIDSNILTDFADDKDIPNWAKGAVAAVKKLGLVEGKGANNFDPNGKTTRAEAVTVLLKMLVQ